jgi:hypothetical protein
MVTRLQEFVELLLPADILLFDKLASLNRLVQWGDNRPVGHCGVWNDGAVYEATLKTLRGRDVGGVFATPFEELLGLKVRDSRAVDLGLVRTVTAVRHQKINEGHREQIMDYLRDRVWDAEFGVKEMVLLTPFAIERSFADSPDRLTDLLVGAIRTLSRLAGYSLSGGPQRLFCSELVYRAYDHAALPITIVDPLFERYQEIRRRSVARLRGAQPREISRGVPRAGREAEPVSADVLLNDYGDFFESQVLAEPDYSPTRGAPQGRRGRGPRPPEFADMITPGDFWSSPDLDPVVVLHRPPGG